MFGDTLWEGWQGPARVVLMGLLTYAFLVLLLRVTGKRTLSKMNAFDLIVTIAIGSAFASVLLDKTITFAEGATAFAVLVLLQYGVAWASARSSRVESLVKSTPTILVWRGEMQREAMTRARVTENEVLAACRAAGVATVGEVDAVVLETAGEFSVIVDGVAPGSDSTLRPAAGGDGT